MARAVFCRRTHINMAMGHPNGVQPWGNYLFTDGLDIRNPGLGLLSGLSDEALLHILSLLDARALAVLAASSKALHCFANHEELWRALVLEELEGKFRWQGSWQETYLRCTVAGYKGRQAPPLRVVGFYSDLLFQPWLCATTPLRAAWLQRQNLPRVSARDLSLEQFREQFEGPNVPVIITDLVGWHATERWTNEYLLQAFKGHKVLAGNYSFDLEDYLKYASGCKDEQPLYLFDQHFADKAPQLAADYTVPPFFQEDLFSLLGPTARPHYRWLIMGPERSGSTFHKDPNGTSAWNAVVRGSKKWVLYPPSVTPPGVHPSDDGAQVAAPVSLVEWFLNFYDQTAEGAGRPSEGVVRAGEVLFVPHGWWHAALNLEETLAVTHNYVSKSNLPEVLRYLRSKSADLVSGCAVEDRADLYERFIERLRALHPEVLEEVQSLQAKCKRVAALASLFQPSIPAPKRILFGIGTPNASTCKSTLEHEEGAENLKNQQSFAFNFAM